MEDKKSLYGIPRCFEIIGKAVKNIPEEVKEKYCQIPNPYNAIEKRGFSLAAT